MASLREQLLGQLARYDDEAYAALANRGLLRRAQKDLEKQPATIAEESDEALVMAFGEHRIHFDARGPAQAKCSCPSSGVCQHILAAAISLQKLGAGPAPDEASRTEPAPADTVAQLHAELAAVDAAQLQRHAGKAGYRWAWQFVQDLEPERVRISGERNIVIGFTHPRISFRYMGGGLDSLVADTQLGQIEKHRVAAVLAWRRAQGLPLQEPEAGRPRNAALDLGKDHALPEGGDAAREESRRRLRASLCLLLGESVELGLSHLSQGIQERYSTLAVWAQGAEYYRLALLLRRVADHVEMLLQRAGGADEHRLLDELALCYGLVGALEQAALRGQAPKQLVGRARSRYEETAALELIGLGATPWRSGSGYVGLTMLLWSPADQSFISCTDARPESQRAFNPLSRYKAPGPWSGLGAPAQATGRRLLLNGAEINAQGRLSAAEGTSALVQDPLPGAELAALLKPQEDWPALLRQRAQGRRSLLSEPDPLKDWAVLRPAQFGAARFDAARQTLLWPLHDSAGATLMLELAYSEYASHAIERIEQLHQGALPAGTLVVARLRSGAAGLVGEPLSLVRPGMPPGQNAVDALYFDPAPAQGFASTWLGKLRQTARPAAENPPAAPAAAMPVALREMRHWLQRRAERGVGGDASHGALQELEAQQRKCASAGFSAFRGGGDDGAVPALLLRSHYLCMQYERLIDDSAEIAA